MPQGLSHAINIDSLAADAAQGNEGAPEMVCAMRLRTYLTPRQVKQAGHTLFVVHRFRNAAVAWLTDRRRQRAAWLKANHGLPKDQIPVDLAGSDALACSKWLTEQLVAARKTVALELGLQAARNDLGTLLARSWKHLSRGEREQLGDAALWLTVSRTALEQVLRDLEKTIAKAIKDRVETKKPRERAKAKAGSPNSGKLSLPVAFSIQQQTRGVAAYKRAPRLAGFPTFHKWQHAGSFRMQVEASKNRPFREHWAAGELYMPGLGRIRFRDRQTLPSTPPKLITLARDAAGRWHVSFLCMAGEGRSQERQRQLWAQPLVLDSTTGMPACRGADAGTKDSLIDDTGTKTGPGRYLRQQLKQLGHLQRGLSRKTRGSSRWKKTKRKIGRLHAKVTQQRDAIQQRIAQDTVKTAPILCLEDLWLQGMLEKQLTVPMSKRLGRALRRAGYDTALGKLNQAIERQAALHGHLILRCDRFDPSTQVCHQCGHRNRELTLDMRTWTCPGCTIVLDRDVNAAINIRRMALKKAIAALSKVSSPSEKEGRTLSSHRLRPDLAAFVARGGLVHWLEHLSSSQDQVVEARVRSGSSGQGRSGTVRQR